MRVACSAEISVQECSRGAIIGKGGERISELQRVTGARISVPGRERPAHHPVRIEAEGVTDLLHMCWELSKLGIGAEEPTACKIQIAEACFALDLERCSSGEFLRGSGMSAYCVYAQCDRDLVDVLVDNERFAHCEVTASCDVKAVQHGHAVFIYGERERKPMLLYDAVKNGCTAAATQAHSELYLSRMLVRDSEPPLVRAFTIGTYNLLHPTYAEKYKESEGVGVDGKSNWPVRRGYIAAMLRRVQLDAYLLSEVDASQMQELALDEYTVHHCTHPNREARDGVAVAVLKRCFAVTETDMVPFDAKEWEYQGQHYMCAAVVFADHIETGVRFAFCSVHFYTKKSVNPQETLLRYLDRRQADFDAVVWGGDCNNVYTSPPGSYQWETESHRATRHVSGKKLDWIFCSNNCSLARSNLTEILVDASKDLLPETGSAASDHFAEAAVVKLLWGGSEETHHET